jgi:hypothetical protein
MTDVMIATELNTGALVVSAGLSPWGLAGVVRCMADALRQRPAAVVLDLTALPSACVLPALALGLGRPRHGVPVIACVPAGSRRLRRIRSVTSAPPADALASLGLRAVEDRVSARFGPDLSAPGMARALVATAVSTWHIDHLGPSAGLIASELVSNAVEHAATDIDFRLMRMRYGLCIAVRDGDPRPPAPSESGRSTLRGRGLRIVARTAHRWGCLLGTADKIVWAVLRDSAPIATPPLRMALMAS